MFFFSWLQYTVTKIFVDLLRPWLEPYIVGASLSGDTVQIGANYVSLNKIEVRAQQLLESLFPSLAVYLPIRINTVAIGTIKVLFSWSELFSAPITVHLGEYFDPKYCAVNIRPRMFY